MKHIMSLAFVILTAALPTCAHEKGELFVTVNPAAAVSFFPGQSDTAVGFFASAVLPDLSNLESGVAVGIGSCRDTQFVEGRVSIGNANDYLLVLQAQAGYFWLIGQMLGRQRKGLYAGASVRYMDIVNIDSNVHNQDILPLASVGYWLDFGGFFLDFRLSQMFLVFSWSSMAHTIPAVRMVFSPLTAISPYMPLLLVSFGYRL